MVCHHASATRGATRARVSLILLMHASASFLGRPVSIQWVVICSLISSWVLQADFVAEVFADVSLRVGFPAVVVFPHERERALFGERDADTFEGEGL